MTEEYWCHPQCIDAEKDTVVFIDGHQVICDGYVGNVCFRCNEGLGAIHPVLVKITTTTEIKE